jgi:hypothetical protein
MTHPPARPRLTPRHDAWCACRSGDMANNSIAYTEINKAKLTGFNKLITGPGDYRCAAAEALPKPRQARAHSPVFAAVFAAPLPFVCRLELQVLHSWVGTKLTWSFQVGDTQWCCCSLQHLMLTRQLCCAHSARRGNLWLACMSTHRCGTHRRHSCLHAGRRAAPCLARGWASRCPSWSSRPRPRTTKYAELWMCCGHAVRLPAVQQHVEPVAPLLMADCVLFGRHRRRRSRCRLTATRGLARPWT